MWQDLIDQKEQWICGKLIDFGDSMDRKMGCEPSETIIVGFILSEKYIDITGEDFSCGGDRQYIGLTGDEVKNGLAFAGYGGHIFHIIKPESRGTDGEAGS